MNREKPFWELNINPITGYYVERWNLIPDELKRTYANDEEE